MPLAGHRLLPREVAQLGAPHWKDVELVKMVATCLGESAGFVGAWHDNGDPPTSRDCGLMQINIPAREVGTAAEDALRTETVDWQKVAAANVAAGYQLYEEPWPREGGPSPAIRRWQPWVAYTTGWATFPAWWTWHQVEGKPVGPWLPTGHYLQQAIAGVANFHLVLKRDRTADQAASMARSYAAHFHVDGEIIVAHDLVGWRVPKKPTEPPADGVGPRPIPNSGL